MPNFYPYINSMPQIDRAIQIGRGVAGAVVGQTYDVYRLNDTTNGSILNNTPVYTKFPARVRNKPSRAAIENVTFDSLIFQSTCDNRDLQIGDLLVQTGYENDGSIFTFSQARPTRETLWIRTEATCSLSRPTPTAGSASQQPVSGIAEVEGYAGFTKASEKFLTLKNGSYAFSYDPTRPQAAVQVGIQPMNRIKDGQMNIPTSLYREHFLIWVPLLPGEMLTELDRIRFPNMDAYEIALLFSTDEIGFSGHICVVERINV